MLRAPPKLAVLLVAGILGAYLWQGQPVLARFTATKDLASNQFTTGSLQPPTNLRTSFSSDSVVLTWTATTSTGASGYKVLRGASATGPFSQIGTVTPRTTTTYTDSTVVARDGVAYYYVVESYLQNWTSANSNVAGATSLGSTADDAVWSAFPSTNFGTATTMSVDGDSSTRKRAFVKFSVTSLPSTATITSANLTLCITSSPAPGAVGHTHNIRRVTGSWTETGLNWNNQPATSSSVTATYTIPSTAQCLSAAVDSDVTAWLGGTANNGWRIADAAEGGSSTSSTVTYGPRETSTTGNRPKLQIAFLP